MARAGGVARLLPLVTMFGFGALGLMPTFATLSVFMVLRRAGNFSITNPAMEVLFTVVKREDKYKAKNIIETFVYRGGDQVGAWAYAGLAALGLSLAGISFVAVPLVVCRSSSASGWAAGRRPRSRRHAGRTPGARRGRGDVSQVPMSLSGR